MVVSMSYEREDKALSAHPPKLLKVEASTWRDRQNHAASPGRCSRHRSLECAAMRWRRADGTGVILAGHAERRKLLCCRDVGVDPPNLAYWHPKARKILERSFAREECKLQGSEQRRARALRVRRGVTRSAAAYGHERRTLERQTERASSESHSAPATSRTSL